MKIKPNSHLKNKKKWYREEGKLELEPAAQLGWWQTANKESKIRDFGVSDGT